MTYNHKTDSNKAASMGGKYESMSEDGGSLYEMLAKHDQSETKCDMLTQLSTQVQSSKNPTPAAADAAAPALALKLQD
jgi:hypothetical protein